MVEPDAASTQEPPTDDPHSDHDTPQTDATADAPAATEPAPNPFDESTWVGLTPEEKDALRAERARREAAAAQPSSRSPATDPSNAIDALRRTQPPASALQLYEARERQMRNATIGIGVAWGASLVLTAIVAGTRAKRLDQQCTPPTIDPTNPTVPDTSGFDRCLDFIDSGNQLTAPLAVLATTTAVTTVGALVSGLVLGLHRNNRFMLEPAGRRSNTARRRARRRHL
ncbi:MAG: hypothetical protein K0V04_24735 [Deltaproteobacteria bacterium]|nr:hypothetical protein [Deltaproteobacteria bacterium]